MDPQQSLREHVLYLLRGGGAHLHFNQAVADLPKDFRGTRINPVPHTAWRLVEHMRIAQWDILQFSRDPQHVSPDFPDGYWPDGDEPPTAEAWDRSITQFREDLESMQGLVADPSADLLARIPHGDGQTLLREALVLADHNAYHLGELVLLRRALGVWPGA